MRRNTDYLCVFLGKGEQRNSKFCAFFLINFLCSMFLARNCVVSTEGKVDASESSSFFVLDEKVNAHLPYYSTLKKFWNGFFQTFQAGLLFFSGGSTTEEEQSTILCVSNPA